MSFVVVRNIKAPLGDIHITGGVIEENVDYSLMVDVCLKEERQPKSTGEENPPITYILVPTGPIRLINMKKIEEQLNDPNLTHTHLAGESGEAQGETAGV